MAADPIPEQVYRDAAVAQQAAWRPDEDREYQLLIAKRMAGDPPFRAVVESVYRAGLAAAAPYIAAKALRDAAADLAGISSSVATTYQAVWLVDRADDIERAARAAGKDKTDG